MSLSYGVGGVEVPDLFYPDRRGYGYRERRPQPRLYEGDNSEGDCTYGHSPDCRGRQAGERRRCVVSLLLDGMDLTRRGYRVQRDALFQEEEFHELPTPRDSPGILDLFPPDYPSNFPSSPSATPDCSLSHARKCSTSASHEPASDSA